ncbi:hypothetical protein GGI04_000040 [Coemansia thaxteri]|uniref:Cation-transporting ATPase n=1 Tax=Coemansia thaxteri TaxID=2663907 RepID=A0A9W8BHN5_9FUNG|nr:hypothetical protein H4R26_000959 [Coemansia thaxteri]KAJ2009941.1 hypothetical protein GGI04_000040 [Coemansia thaxteri]KAJ2473505.1 hypothetical protein GGI02_000792 [Coemansia sp. RSA 2322]KAJ2484036.1 hypothetical protein EV174_002754 [Coemansia sp. RSA 2320]
MVGANRFEYVQDVYLAEEDMHISLHGYRRSNGGTVVYWVLVACTVGLLFVVDSWLHTISIWFTHRRAPLRESTSVQVLGGGKHLSFEDISTTPFDGALDAAFEPALSEKDSERDVFNLLDVLRVFSFRHYRLVFLPASAKFAPVSKWKDPEWSQGVVTGRKGLSEREHNLRLLVFGPCIIDIQEKSYVRLLWEEALNPFYIFQLASIIIWSCEDYYYYACAIFIISAISIASTLISTKRTVCKIREMSAYTCTVRVLRTGKWLELPSSDLVPGDIIDLTEATCAALPCDAMLLEGDCVVNESMLTGESVPESKSPLDRASRALQDVDMAAHTLKPSISRHVLFAGTQIIRARKVASVYGDDGDTSSLYSTQPATSRPAKSNLRATAMVLRTGFCTTKGTLTRSILFPRPTKFRFYRDAFCFVGVLAAIAVVGFTINSINLHHLGVSRGAIAKKALDLITVVVPPALPACMSIGMAFAARRLRKEGIFCISPSRINVASKVALMCFDKTGTLTEDGLDLLGVHAVSQSTKSFMEMQTTIEQVAGQAVLAESGEITDNVGAPGLAVINALATCHSLRLVDGVPVGDPLETKMLEFTGWQIKESDLAGVPADLDEGVDGQDSSDFDLLGSLNASCLTTAVYPPQTYELDAAANGASRIGGIGILKSFEFSPSLRRSSVVVKQLGGGYVEVYVKGAPEIVRELCNHATVPADYERTMNEYTQHGYRVIALAGKTIKRSWRSAVTLDRAEAERDLVFMGFLVFENKLKATTASVLCELREARIRMVMCTGDNPLTAVSVACECSLVVPDVKVFVSRFSETNALSTSFSEHNIFAPLARVSWSDSSGSGVVLDPVSLLPRAVDNNDPAAVMLAEDLATSGRYCVAVTGDVFGYLSRHAQGTHTWKHMLMRAAVYARMSPEQKAEMIEQMQELGYITGFCGDGANDCGALKSADVGISLSEAEASVAAPFTSSANNIGCVVQLLKEGRCSIATSFGCFKYMALYSMIQFTSCCLLYIYNVNLTDGQYLYVDLFTILPVAVCMDRARPFRRLVPKRPSASLTSKKVLTSLLGNVALVIGFQIAVFFMVEAQPWYQRPHPKDPSDPDSTPKEGDLNTSLYLFTTFQYLFGGVIFNIGPPYRQPAYRNIAYVVVVAVLLAFNLWVLLAPVGGFLSLFGLMHTKVSWRLTILGMAAANFVLCYAGEWLLFPRLAIPLAKLFRLTGLVFSWNRPYSEPSQAEIVASDMDENGNRQGGLWTRLGQRRNRKEYKLLLRGMAGGSSWH